MRKLREAITTGAIITGAGWRVRGRPALLAVVGACGLVLGMTAWAAAVVHDLKALDADGGAVQNPNVVVKVNLGDLQEIPQDSTTGEFGAPPTASSTAVRYESPTIAGFALSASWGEQVDYYDAMLKLLAGYGPRYTGSFMGKQVQTSAEPPPRTPAAGDWAGGMKLEWGLNSSWSIPGNFGWARTYSSSTGATGTPATTGSGTTGGSTWSVGTVREIDRSALKLYLDYRHQDSGGSPVVGTGGADGTFKFDTGLLMDYGGKPANLRGGYVATLGESFHCEGMTRFIPDGAGSGPHEFRYLDICPICWRNAFFVAKSAPDGCTHMQLPAQIAQAQGQGAPSPDDMGTQWAFRTLGLPLRLPWPRLAPVTVAVIDSGLDFRNPNIDPRSVWINPRPGADPAYPGDVVGWNFVARHNNPVDDVGHGTFVAGLILAVNPRAQILPIKILDSFGSGLDSAIGRAVVYAVRRGARVINLSVGRRGLSEFHQDVVDYARSRGVVVVVAAGNEGKALEDYTPGGVKGALVVAATDRNDRKAGFGNWGQNVSLAAPGVDIVSLRAAWTDFVLVATGGKDYKPGDNFVGKDGWHYRASGTSFAAPFVSGAAALLFSLYPNLTGRQVERMLVESADDVEVPGWDQFTGTGRLNLARAVLADPNAYLRARVSRVQPGRQGGQTVIQVFGTADGNRLRGYRVDLGRGESPTSWKTVARQAGQAVEGDLLAVFSLREITARGAWRIRVVVEDTQGRTREAWGNLDVK